MKDNIIFKNSSIFRSKSVSKSSKSNCHDSFVGLSSHVADSKHAVLQRSIGASKLQLSSQVSLKATTTTATTSLPNLGFAKGRSETRPRRVRRHQQGRAGGTGQIERRKQRQSQRRRAVARLLRHALMAHNAFLHVQLCQCRVQRVHSAPIVRVRHQTLLDRPSKRKNSVVPNITKKFLFST